MGYIHNEHTHRFKYNVNIRYITSSYYSPLMLPSC